MKKDKDKPEEKKEEVWRPFQRQPARKGFPYSEEEEAKYKKPAPPKKEKEKKENKK
jgi:hypothetical protein